MAKFLHIADVHLGFDRYSSKVRTQDFFHTLWDVFERYAIQQNVDFVAIAGDLFEHRMIQPAILNQAQLCLQQLQAAEIPVIAIEGNHDNCPYGTKTSWLRYLSDWGLLKLLEPGSDDTLYLPWNEKTKRGSYIDLDCGVRVLGASWYGAAAPKAIEQIATAIETLPTGPGSTVLLFHHGLEGQIARYSGALRYSDLLPLKEAGVDYLGLGHIHKHYTVDNWVFNPGSLEANNVDEASFERGALLVNIDAGQINAQLQTNYRQRPITRLSLKLRGHEALEDIEGLSLKTIDQAINQKRLFPDQQPIVELRIEGEVGFDRLELDTRSLQNLLQTYCNALIFLLKYEVDNVAYGTPLPDDADRHQIEREIFVDLLTANNVYKKRAQPLAAGLIELKDRQLTGDDEETLYTMVEQMLAAPPPTSSRASSDHSR
ncbi:dna repair exonuclease [Leptolyngbya sp. Heron Island J]|uniref:metallophosphoesterase family protein n=1 Tax=Leptolyngbya sp. Heron Island J TaxID=1385935 RepID=UPI0003B9A6D9|nr:metallophosphoesterase [Leptolyngbya sp. Heron Island J]ESA38051.1 dna repair exonuclease [Leptolyngbya sp. Heron Island J]